MSQIFNQITYKYKTRFIKISGYDIAYIDEGDSSNTLLFIHGLGSYLKAWDRNIIELKNHFRCIALDLPGYGKSSKQIHSGSVSFYVEIIKEFISTLNLKVISLVGHSMGGQIAMAFTIKYPEVINKLILVAPAGFEVFEKNEIDFIKQIVSPEILYQTSDNQIKLNYKMNFYNMPIEAEEMIADRITIKNDEEFFNHCKVVSNSLFGLLNEPVYNSLQNIIQPTLIFFGKNDLLIPNPTIHQTTTVNIAENGKSKIRNSKLILYENCGHFIQFEKPEQFNHDILNFIQ